MSTTYSSQFPQDTDDANLQVENGPTSNPNILLARDYNRHDVQIRKIQSVIGTHTSSSTLVSRIAALESATSAGTTWHFGTSYPGSASSGDLFLNTSTYDVDSYNGTSWVNVGNLKGATGPAAAATYDAIVPDDYSTPGAALAAGAKRIFVKEGTYNDISSSAPDPTTALSHPIYVHGENTRKTVWKHKGIKLGDGAEGSSFRNLTMQGDGEARAYLWVEGSSGVNDLEVLDVNFVNIDQTALKLDTANNISLERIYFESDTSSGTEVVKLSDVTDVTLRDFQFKIQGPNQRVFSLSDGVTRLTLDSVKINVPSSTGTTVVYGASDTQITNLLVTDFDITSSGSQDAICDLQSPGATSEVTTDGLRFHNFTVRGNFAYFLNVFSAYSIRGIEINNVDMTNGTWNDFIVLAGTVEEIATLRVADVYGGTLDRLFHITDGDDGGAELLDFQVTNFQPKAISTSGQGINIVLSNDLSDFRIHNSTFPSVGGTADIRGLMELSGAGSTFSRILFDHVVFKDLGIHFTAASTSASKLFNFNNCTFDISDSFSGSSTETWLEFDFDGGIDHLKISEINFLGKDSSTSGHGIAAFGSGASCNFTLTLSGGYVTWDNSNAFFHSKDAGATLKVITDLVHTVAGDLISATSNNISNKHNSTDANVFTT